MTMQDQVNETPAPKRLPWNRNKGKFTGAKPPLQSTVRYLGIEVDGALAIAGQVDV
jgi:hypothetical protein